MVENMVTDLCRCGHLIRHHEIATGWHGNEPFRRESCRAHETGLFDVCACSKVRVIDNLGYLQVQYEKAVESRQRR